MSVKDLEAQELLEFARFTGPGTRLYRSPKPDEVEDIALPPMKWVQIDPIYKRSGTFQRDRRNKLFEVLEATGAPDDIDFSIPDSLFDRLDAGQREMVRMITISVEKTPKPEYLAAVSLSDMVDGETGLPRANTWVTVEYLKNNHRLFLMALEAVEKRFQKRKTLLSLIAKNLARIGKLPG